MIGEAAWNVSVRQVFQILIISLLIWPKQAASVDPRAHATSLIALSSVVNRCKEGENLAVTAAVHGVESGVTYRVVFGVFTHGRQYSEHETFFDVLITGDAGQFSIPTELPPMSEGKYILSCSVYDRHPSVSQDEALLARREEAFRCEKGDPRSDTNVHGDAPAAGERASVPATSTQHKAPDRLHVLEPEMGGRDLGADVEAEYYSDLSKLPPWESLSDVEEVTEHPTSQAISLRRVGEACKEAEYTFVKGEVGGLVAGSRYAMHIEAWEDGRVVSRQMAELRGGRPGLFGLYFPPLVTSHTKLYARCYDLHPMLDPDKALLSEWTWTLQCVAALPLSQSPPHILDTPHDDDNNSALPSLTEVSSAKAHNDAEEQEEEEKDQPWIAQPEDELLNIIFQPLSCKGGAEIAFRAELRGVVAGVRYKVRGELRLPHENEGKVRAEAEATLHHRRSHGRSHGFVLRLPPVRSGMYTLTVTVVDLKGEGGPAGLLASLSLGTLCHGDEGDDDDKKEKEQEQQEQEQEEDLWPIEEDGWRFETERWKEWFVPLYAETALHALRLSTSTSGHISQNASQRAPIPANGSESAVHASFGGRVMSWFKLGSPKSSDRDGVVDEPVTETRRGGPGLDFGVSVMNLRSRRDRRDHSLQLLSSVGFSNLSFPETTAARDLDVEEALREGAVLQAAVDSISGSPYKGPGAVRPYLANAVDQVQQVRERAGRGEALFGVFEDDLMGTASDPDVVRERVVAALAELPASADVLYLECCFESCRKLRYGAGRGRVARLFEPYCSGAILFTAKGARKVAARCWPVFDSLDDMYHALVQNGTLEAYLAVPPPFVQDAFWGTDANRSWNLRGQLQPQPTQHGIYASPCHEFQHYPTALEAPIVAASRLPSWSRLEPSFTFRQDECEAARAEGCAYAVLPHDGTRHDADQRWQGLVSPSSGMSVVYYTQGRGGGVLAEAFVVEVGRWTNHTEGAVLTLTDESACWQSRDGLCAVEMALTDQRGSQLGVDIRFFFLHWPHLGGSHNSDAR